MGEAGVDEALRFAVCTFDRVFDTAPKQETLLLGQLVTALLRFELKPELQQRVVKNERKLSQVWDSWRAGTYRSGKQYAAIKNAVDAARRDDGDPDVAAEEAYARLLTEARGAPKRDLRLWSPALYQPGAKRGGDGVVHISCLVLDYDKGLAFDEAQPVWDPWFHVAHSTWSHGEEKPKYRIILPMAGPVAAGDWRAVWSWAQELAGAWIDPAMSARAATYALPTSPGAEAPKIAHLHRDAPLFDPLGEGLISAYAAPPTVVAEIDRPQSHFNGGVAGHTYQELGPGDLIDEPPHTLDVSGEWDVAPPPEAIATGTPPRLAPPETPAAEEQPASWDERSDEWETLFDEF